MDVLKEDRQAFGLLVGKVSTPAEALAYSLTSVPLALVDPDKTLRSQTTKSSLRNHLISTAKAGNMKLETNCLTDWYIDGMLAVNALNARKLGKILLMLLYIMLYISYYVLSYCTPKYTSNIKRLSIIFDSYDRSSIKQEDSPTTESI